MTTPATGAIRFSDVRTATGQSGQISASNYRFRIIANGVNSGAVSMSSCRNKPTPGSLTVAAGSSQGFTIPAYTSLYIDVYAGGGGGGYGKTSFYFGPGDCRDGGGGASGGTGGTSSAWAFAAYGGTGGNNNFGNGTDGGNNQNTATGGGAAGGTGAQGQTAPLCPAFVGGNGGAGGRFYATVAIGVNGPEYLTGITVTGGAGGTGGNSNNNPGGGGYAYLQWS